MILGYITALASIPACTLVFLWRDKRDQEQRAAQAFADEVENYLRGPRD